MSQQIKPLPKYFILNSPEDIQECNTCDEYFAWHERQDEADQTVLGIRIELSRLVNGVVVSTVFCGDDSAGYVKGKPLLFETRVADPNGYFAHYTVRSPDYHEILDIHYRVLKSVSQYYNIAEGKKQNASVS